ncbi:hypothetical protein HX910_000780 [Salmonella enterica]|nr:hypothetical protein [Salmonella enterica]EFP4633808.1 hypothetical protein [Salmonella enterica]EFS0362268.1 hypothetical protein [Salmonella enterica]EGK1504578.1 hypothetical protein [Salmonella enterica]
MKITMEHIRAGGGCAWGIRAFFARYNLDLNAFLERGWIESEVLINTGDALALRIVERARAGENDGR